MIMQSHWFMIHVWLSIRLNNLIAEHKTKCTKKSVQDMIRCEKKILLPLFIKYNLAKMMVMFYLQKGIHPGVYEVQFLADLTRTSFPLAWEYSSLLQKWSPRKCINSLLPDILNRLFINRQSHIFFISY